jgi:ubiquinone/menaquinone biosynthesis C-methylase UbiE
VAGWFDFPRVPEPEVMDDSGEVHAYSSSAAQEYLSVIDDTFVVHALQLLGAPDSLSRSGRALDIGTGPGQIVLKLAHRLPDWELIGVDRSPNMIREALTARDQSSVRDSDLDLACGARVEFLLADGTALPFADASFDLVLCNSVLHHLERPELLFAEIARVAHAGSAILIRDLRRPSRLAYPLHVRWYGRHYAGLMYKLYCDSVRAAYTLEELSALLHASPLCDARVFTRGRTHLGIARTKSQSPHP